ncbi:MAG: acyltransferase family protein [Pseudomonadales bacterium]|nr:acyltransferase [Pseudomonadales bacterium]
MSNALSYRHDIDGLRAIAVLAVIAAHLPEKFLPSGFLGVDVFFAISGFVVTGSILGQRRTEFGQLYLGFLAKRVRRLLPALALCVAITGSVVLAVDPFPRHSVETGLAALFGSANVALYFFELDYFSPSSVFNAFTHTWSLGVEEQFYLVFPTFAWLFFFRTSRKSYKPLAVATICGGTFSVSLFVLLYRDYQPLAFFMMPTRIWELGLGAVVLLASRRLQSTRLKAILRRISPLVLIALFGCFIVPEAYAMPATIAVVVLTGLLLASDQQSPAGRVLTLPPVVYAGRISYSLYLWHWPIIALAPIVLSSAWRSSALYVVATVIVAVASFHAVERPLRYRKWTGHRGGDIGAGIAGNLFVGAALILTMFFMSTSGNQAEVQLHPPAYLPLEPSGRVHNLTCALDGGSRKFAQDTIELCTMPPEPDSGMPTLWVMGDSHSGHLQGMLYELRDRIGIGVHLVETPGYPFPFDGDNVFAPRQQVFSSIYPLIQPGDIVIVARLYLARTPPYTPEDLGPWLSQVSALADGLAQRGVSLVVTGPPPIFPFDDVRQCSLEERTSCRLELKNIVPSIREVERQLESLEQENANVSVFFIFDSVCPPNNGYCYPDDGHSFLYRDKDHFNSLGSRRLAGPFTEFLRSSGLIQPAR